MYTIKLLFNKIDELKFCFTVVSHIDIISSQFSNVQGVYNVCEN